MRKILNILVAAVMSVSCAVTASAQDSAALPKERALEVLTRIADNYKPWSSVETSGKLKMSGLPITVNVKLYMRKGESLMLSLRAPLIGEAGRIEMDRDSILAVNKMKGVYCKESMEGLLQIYPGGIDDIQSFLLGRVVVLGEGELTPEMNNRLTVYDAEENGNMIVPDESIQPTAFNYGYITYSDGHTAALVVSGNDDSFSMNTEYDYLPGMDMDIQLNLKGKQFDASLQLNEYKEDAREFDHISLGKKYTRVGIRDFLRSF